MEQVAPIITIDDFAPLLRVDSTKGTESHREPGRFDFYDVAGATISSNLPHDSELFNRVASGTEDFSRYEAVFIDKGSTPGSRKTPKSSSAFNWKSQAPVRRIALIDDEYAKKKTEMYRGSFKFKRELFEKCRPVPLALYLALYKYWEAGKRVLKSVAIRTYEITAEEIVGAAAFFQVLINLHKAYADISRSAARVHCIDEGNSPRLRFADTEEFERSMATLQDVPCPENALDFFRKGMALRTQTLNCLYRHAVSEDLGELNPTVASFKKTLNARNVSEFSMALFMIGVRAVRKEEKYIVQGQYWVQVLRSGTKIKEKIMVKMCISRLNQYVIVFVNNSKKAEYKSRLMAKRQAHRLARQARREA